MILYEESKITIHQNSVEKTYFANSDWNLIFKNHSLNYTIIAFPDNLIASTKFLKFRKCSFYIFGILFKPLRYLGYRNKASSSFTMSHTESRILEKCLVKCLKFFLTVVIYSLYNSDPKFVIIISHSKHFSPKSFRAGQGVYSYRCAH